MQQLPTIKVSAGFCEAIACDSTQSHDDNQVNANVPKPKVEVETEPAQRSQVLCHEDVQLSSRTCSWSLRHHPGRTNDE